MQQEVHYHFFFEAHGFADEVPLLGAAFKKCDLYIPEMLENTANHVRKTVDLSCGTWIPTEWKIGGRYTKEYYDFFVGSRKPLLVLERPRVEGAPRLRDIFKQLKEAEILFVDGERNQAIDKTKQVLTALRDYTRTREDYIIQDFDLKVRRTIAETPTLCDKAVVRVLLSMGSGHVRVYETIKLQFPSRTTMEVTAEGRTLRVLDETLVKMVSTNAQPSKRVLLQIIIESILLREWMHKGGHQVAGILAVKKKIRQLTNAELELIDVQDLIPPG